MAGRPTKLTPELQQTICDVLRNCGSRTAAVGRANIDYSTFSDWMQRGVQATSGKYRDFLLAVRDAEAQTVLMAVRTVRLKIVGGWHKVPMRHKDRNIVFKRDPITKEILRDAQGRPEAELADVYKEPDAALAAWYLEHRDPANWGNTSGEGVTVNLNPAPAQPNPGKKKSLDLFSLAIQILVDNGMPVPKPKTKHQDQKAIEITATPAGSGEKGEE